MTRLCNHPKKSANDRLAVVSTAVSSKALFSFFARAFQNGKSIDPAVIMTF
ncbi:hypothetical protein JCM19047_1852 [Bacillus sp. JCM 19047]|nr:hypothetical protein JCM19047_1852 [Bacillus sp. JCM 19047]